MLSWLAVGLVALLPMWLWASEFAWQRGIRGISVRLFGNDAPDSIRLATPEFMLLRRQVLLFSVVGSFLVSWLLVGFGASIAVSVSTVVVAVVASRMLPPAASGYYIGQLVDERATMARIADATGNTAEAKRRGEQAEVFRGDLPEMREERRQSTKYWRANCARPPRRSFAQVLEMLGPTDRELVEQKVVGVGDLIRSTFETNGPERMECERRRYSRLLLTNYISHLASALEGVSNEDRETITGLACGGLAIERLLSSVGETALFTRVFSDQEMVALLPESD
jgi:hypothetical protein